MCQSILRPSLAEAGAHLVVAPICLVTTGIDGLSFEGARHRVGRARVGDVSILARLGSLAFGL
jgi:hypothetical protein